MLGFLKKKKAEPATKKNSFGEPLDKLVDGELPWGWITAHKDFTDGIEKEFAYFWNAWINARKDPINERNALKSLLQYMDDVQRMCDQKGECFGFWCAEYLIGKQKERCASRLSDIEQE